MQTLRRSWNPPKNRWINRPAAIPRTIEDTHLEIVDGKPYIDQVRNRIIEYTSALGRNLDFQGLEEELADPAGKYTPPAGELLVACEGGFVWGIVAYHRHSDERCEMKRLYVDPGRRGEHLGEKLVSAIIEHARTAGYKEMVLDTLEPMHAAISIYKEFGFEECEAYYNNPMDDVIYIKKAL